ncbi:YciI family protein [Paraburkholderia sp. DHOC27]|uniref:YciI family protein n=1 Tax=Paraburkholderia sp. DHOC27 TaxID=2303330 RepID=UPI000E3CCDD1|nr:YciI family protein [Paraburkholderia sp. DHOC27]RFU49192.1 GTP cyclohydrolase [Paraburkholderia sp. DHOC27]
MLHIVISSYTPRSAELDARMPEHLAFLETYHRAGCFLLSGSKSTCDGGIVIAQTRTREELVEIMERDPLRRLGLLDYEIMGFAPNRRALALTEELFLSKGKMAQVLEHA